MTDTRADAAPAPSGRYQLRGQLGSGGTGVVHRVFDRVRGREVALKSLRRADGRDLFRFKREFRALADLAHPNLVALHELTRVGAEWMFTMELVDGVPFSSWVRGGGAVDGDDTRPGAQPVDLRRFAALDAARLRDALTQLADGLLALHDAGKLHRDLKPSNVLVDRSGRVVILDFGLVADLFSSDHTHDQLAVGTPAFMSPEQAGDLPLSEATDWYSVGVMLYEALTGRRPFEGPLAEVMARKRSEDALAPSNLDPTVPADLDALCTALLDRDPARRPDGRGVLAALGRAPSAATARIAHHAARPPFVGRSDELAALRSALEHSRRGSVVQVVIGASGMGKSALIRAFLDEVSVDAEAVVVEGRCFEREAVPYKTLDGVVDELTGYLASSGYRTDAMPMGDMAALLRLFPVLRRVPWMQVPTLPGSVPADPAQLRLRALRALRALFAQLAARGPVVVSIDDLQWGDADGAAALAELVDGGGDQPGLLVVASHRSEDLADGTALAWMRRRVPSKVRELALEALPERDVRALWERLGGEADDDGAVRDAAGSPLLLGEIAAARAAGTRSVATVAAAVQARMARLDRDAQALLRTVAVAGRPLRVAVAPHAAGVADVSVDAALVSLRAERLVRLRGSESVVEIRHDRIRSAVVAGIAEDERRAIHARLAVAIAADDPGDTESLLEHWMGAGEGGRASEHAELAAAAAEERLAFNRAAELLGLALLRGDLDDARRLELLTRRGRALAAAGRLVEAAVELRGASAIATGRERLALERLAIENLLKAGQLDRGLRAADGLLHDVGESLPKRPTLALVIERTRLRVRGLGFRERDAASVDPAVLDRLDALWSLASGLSFVDPVLGIALHTRLLRGALDAGEPRRVAMAIGLELGYVAVAGGAAAGRMTELRELGSGLARRLGQPDVLGFIEAGGGVGAYLAGHFRDGLARIDAGAALMRERPAEVRWQLDLAEIFRLVVLWWMGDLRQLCAVHGEQLRVAVDGGNLNSQRHQSSWPGNVVWLIDGKPGESRARIEAALAAGSGSQRFHLHHYHAAAGLACTDLYEGRGEDAHRRFESAWRGLERSHVLRVQLVEIESRYIRGCAAVAAGGRDRLALASDCATRIARHDVPHAQALATELHAAIAAARGELAVAVSDFRAAVALAESADLAVHAAVSRLRLGDLLGATEGAALTAAATSFLTEQGVADPTAFASMVVPRTN